MFNKFVPSFFGGRGELHSTVYGMRNWSIDAMGRLAGVMYKKAVWRPGPNYARCMRSPKPTSYTIAQYVSPTATTATYSSPSVPAEGFEPDHTMVDCAGPNGNGHGFYAYYDGSRDYHEKGDVTGVIKGWGEAIVGDKGFRVMIAEIVAIKFSGSVTKPTRDRITSVYPDVAVFTSLDKMLTEFPLTADGLEYVPEADDEFWTREA